MPDQSWFRHWAKEALLSDDLDALTDHEERVWWRLLSSASLAEQRWSIDITARLAAKCKSTPAKFAKAVARFIELDMITVEWPNPDRITITNAPKWNEERNGKAPSASAEATRARKAAERERKRRERDSHEDVTTLVTTPVTRDSHDHKEEEKEKEEEPEEEKIKSAPTSRHRAIDEAFLVELQAENPTVNVRQVLAKAENRRTWDGYKDKRRALRDHVGYALEELAKSRTNGRGPTLSRDPRAEAIAAGFNVDD